MARRFCTHCHAACGPADRFCAACGQPLAAAAASPSGDWGEVKAATILFADIVDSTRQIAELSPEQAMQRLQPAVERIVRIVDGRRFVRSSGNQSAESWRVESVSPVSSVVPTMALETVSGTVEGRNAYAHASRGV